jgi:hypothetical protein
MSLEAITQAFLESALIWYGRHADKKAKAIGLLIAIVSLTTVNAPQPGSDLSDDRKAAKFLAPTKMGRCFTSIFRH